MKWMSHFLMKLFLCSIHIPIAPESRINGKMVRYAYCAFIGQVIGCIKPKHSCFPCKVSFCRISYDNYSVIRAVS